MGGVGGIGDGGLFGLTFAFMFLELPFKFGNMGC